MKRTDINTIENLSYKLKKDLSKDFEISNLSFYEKYGDRENLYCKLSFEVKIPHPVNSEKIASYIFVFWDKLRQNFKLEKY